ncbi:SDR family oxidoreductase [Aureliella helgolandensis]|uniref:UDP-glucose 4-epimerase n=1 Tax=Aureliella helgolandensis TaxID=2527968 RepID=A0A518G5S0_9BACT|nr:SDR family oxidoreductase [Aureliella helgolandensis]QDV23946.1 UDP-glucose 4-epimerase [Aureliella helgolandensis]
MAKVLVTGGAGFIASHITTAVVERGDQVRVLDNLCTGFKHNLAHVWDDIEFVEGDICDEAAVSKAMQGVELVFHQAALASVPLSIEKPLEVHQACATGTLNVLNQAVKAGVRRVVYAASSSAYGDRPFTAKRESDLPQVLSPYAAAKLAGELYCQAFYHSFGLETVGLRYFNVFGPRQDPASPYSAVIPLFVTAILSGKPPTIYGDGGQSRDFIYVGNVVQGNLLAAESAGAAGQVINMAEGRQTSLLQLLEHLSNLLGKKVTPDFQPARVGDVRESLADITLARSLLGFEPQTNLETGLRQTIDYYRQLSEAKLGKA